MKLSRIASFVFAGVVSSGLSLVSGEIPSALRDYESGLKASLSGVVSYRKLDATSYEALDGSGKVLGCVVLDGTAKGDMALGFGGPVPVAVTVDQSGKITGVLLGKNEETPGFLRRVKKSGYLSRWNGVVLTSAWNHPVEAVSHATRSSTAIRSGVKAISRAAALKAGMKVAAVEPVDVAGLRARLKNLEGGIAFCDRFTEQWKTKTDAEIEARFIYAVEGSEAGDKAAKERGVKIFKHGKQVIGERLQALVDNYKKAPTEANKAAVKEQIQKDVAYLKQAILDHKAELLKSKAAIEAQLKKVAEPAGQCMMRFHSPEAKKLEARIQALAAVCKKAPNAAHNKALREALEKQLDSGIKAMGGVIAKKEAELKKLKATYERIAADPDKVIEKRFKALTKTCDGKCENCKKH